MKHLITCLTLLALTCLGTAQAHETSDHLLTLTQEDKHITGHWDVQMKDLDFALKLDLNGDGQVSNPELVQEGQRVRDYLLSHLTVTAAGQGCTLTDTRMQVGETPRGPFLRLGVAGSCLVVPERLTFKNTLFTDVDDQGKHRGYLTLTVAGFSQTTVFTRETPESTLSLLKPNLLQTLGRFIWLGMTHIWLGFDHVLFLITLLLPAVLVYQSNRWEPVSNLRRALLSVLKVVTAFTVAHSVTLALSALGFVSPPSKWVEVVIALSVVFASLNNLFPVVLERSRWVVALGFGLIHGFGFSSVLSELIADRRVLVESLVGFNVGVELGQLAIVLGMVPLMFWWRSTVLYRRFVFQGVSAAVVVVASVWFAERLLG